MENKVLLIMPKLVPGKDFHRFPFECLALAASLETLGITCDIFDERVASEESILECLADYAIIGVSMFTGYQTHRGNYWLNIVRQRNPQAVTIAGGPHVTALPEETVASPLVDFRRLCFFDATLFTTRTRTMELVAHLDQRFAGREWIADARAAELIRYSEDDLHQFRNCRMNLLTLVVGLDKGLAKRARSAGDKDRFVVEHEIDGFNAFDYQRRSKPNRPMLICNAVASGLVP